MHLLGVTYEQVILNLFTRYISTNMKMSAEFLETYQANLPLNDVKCQQSLRLNIFMGSGVQYPWSFLLAMAMLGQRWQEGRWHN